MMAPRKNTPSEDPSREDWSRILAFAGLAASVLGILLVGAVLRTEVPLNAAEPRLPAPGIPSESRPIEPATADRAAATPSEPPGSIVDDPLEQRAVADLEKLAGDPSGWTAQLAVLCDTEHAATLVSRFGEHESFHVLPSYHREQACYRICWSRYDTLEAARRANDLPAGLRALEARPLPKSITEVLP
jgi:hypothetical protein